MSKDKKNKKHIKKAAKKVVKKAAKKIVKSKNQLTPDQQSTQIEMMKTILSRQPNPGMALDPQYRDLIQKNQQLNEMKNQKEFYINNMKATIDSNQEHIKKMNQQEKELKELKKDNERKAALQKQEQRLQDKKEEAEYQHARLEKKNEIGKMEQEISDTNMLIKRMQRDNEEMKTNIRGNRVYDQLQQKKQELKDIQNQRRVLDQVIASDEFQHADDKFVQVMYQTELEKIKLEQQKEIYKKEKEIEDERAKTNAFIDARKLYLRPNTMRPKRDKDGHIIYQKDQQGQIKRDDKGNPIPVLEFDPDSSEFKQNKKELQHLEMNKLQMDQIVKQYQEEYKLKNAMIEKLTDAKVSNIVHDTKLKALQEFNKKQEEDNASTQISEQLKNELQTQASNELKMNQVKQRHKQLLEEQELQRKSEYLNFRKQQINDPERKAEQEAIANKQIELDNMKRMNDLKEQEIKAMEIEQKHSNQYNTRKFMSNYPTLIDADNVAQVVTQIREQEEANSKDMNSKVLLINQVSALEEAFKHKYEGNSNPILIGILTSSGLNNKVDINSSVGEIQKQIQLMQYTLDHYSIPEDENVQSSYHRFIDSDEIKNFFA